MHFSNPNPSCLSSALRILQYLHMGCCIDHTTKKQQCEYLICPSKETDTERLSAKGESPTYLPFAVYRVNNRMCVTGLSEGLNEPLLIQPSEVCSVNNIYCYYKNHRVGWTLLT